MRVRELQPWILGSLLSFGWIIQPAFSAEKIPTAAVAEKYVQQALTAELTGNDPQRAALLAEAIKAQPDFAAARWHSGQIRLGEKWVPLEVAEQQATKAGTITEYRRLREQVPATEAGHLAMARWCRRSELANQESMHWVAVIQLNPRNGEARNRLGLREHEGRLLTAEGIEQEKAWRKDFEKKTSQWTAWVKERRFALEKEDSEANDQALIDIAAVEDVAAVPLLEAGISTTHKAGALAVVTALGKMKQQVAIDSLVRHAVFSDHEEVRQAASKELKARALHCYVPMLLSNLKAPLEFTQTNAFFGNGYSRAFVFEREEQSSVNYDIRALDKWVHVLGNGPSPEREAAATFERANLWREAHLEWQRGSVLRHEVDRINKADEGLNQRLLAVLRYCTEQELDDRAKSWWKWWGEYNESAYESAVKPLNNGECRTLRKTVPDHHA